MSKLAIGTAQFGNINYGIANKLNCSSISTSEVFEILNYAIGHGVNLLDTASTYGCSETLLGQFQLEPFQIVTKLPPIREEICEVSTSVETLIGNSLSKLRVNKLYGLLLHDPSQLNSIIGPNLYRSLLVAKDQGQVAKIGVSVYSPWELELYLSKYKFDIVQFPFNIFDRRFLENDLIKRLYESGVEIHVRSIFLQGLLLMTNNQRPKYFNKWWQLWNQWDDWLRIESIDPLYACKAYVESIPEISKIIVGVDGLNQFKKIVEVKKCCIEFPNFAVNQEELLDPRAWS